MARPFELVKNIDDTKELWKLAIRIHHRWTVVNKNKEHFELVVVNKDVSISFYPSLYFKSVFFFVILFYPLTMKIYLCLTGYQVVGFLRFPVFSLFVYILFFNLHFILITALSCWVHMTVQ